jgi:ribose transport system substrate-binding protein
MRLIVTYVGSLNRYLLNVTKITILPNVSTPGSTLRSDNLDPSAIPAGTTRKNAIGMELVYVPPGEFMMGSTQTQVDEALFECKKYDKDCKRERFTNELPKHKVTIKDGFWIGKFEVTQGQWESVAKTTVLQQRDKGNSTWPIFSSGVDLPMYYVSWDDIQIFLKRLNEKNDGFEYSLPSEAQWEYAARSGTATAFAFGDSLKLSQANFCDVSPCSPKGKVLGKTAPVGTYQPNNFGLYDMHGNVWEWCEDIYNNGYGGLPTDGSANVSVGDLSSRVLRGGSWLATSYHARSAYRYVLSASFRGDYTAGFRVVARAIEATSGNTVEAQTVPKPVKPNNSGTASRKILKLSFVTNNASDYWTFARKGVEKADAEMEDVTVAFKLPGTGSPDEQKRIIDDLVATGIDGIAMSPVDPDNQTQLINNTAKKTLLITQDSDAPNSDRAFYVGTDNVAAGRQAGKAIKEALPYGGRIMVFVGVSSAPNAAGRYQGLKEALQGSNVKIIDIRIDGTDRSRARANAAEALVKYPDIAGMVGLWSYNGPAILYAVRNANKVGKVKIICFEEEDETLAGIMEGSIFATVVQQPYEFGYQSVKLMAQILRGDKSGIPTNKQIYIPSLVIKKNTVQDFVKNLNQLRGRW